MWATSERPSHADRGQRGSVHPGDKITLHSSLDRQWIYCRQLPEIARKANVESKNLDLLPPRGHRVQRTSHQHRNYPYGVFGVGMALPRDQPTVVCLIQRTLTRLCWPCGCCSEGRVGRSLHLQAAAHKTHRFRSFENTGFIYYPFD